ncbi:hypothetical protein [Thalassomonas actiniarum]|uniref:Uncharacterized protein n=1 Tax=Thalassomonas actiniarum TaxID=485447 RepID=A0AAE9YY62_9GAMM|nr:hypothetical protein [Thalassomonas actiniarum]WDE01688.1 hypothetical protein SG35_014285 [Thalassomonas actiniarum]
MDDSQRASELQSEVDLDAPVRQVDGEGNYIPNSISIGNRLLHIILSISLLFYGAYGVYTDDLYIPSRRDIFHFSGLAAWLVYAGMICLCAYLLSVVIDHYDKRDNEHQYYKFGKRIRLTGFILFLIAIAFHFSFNVW